MRRNTGTFHTNLRYSTRCAASDDRLRVSAGTCFIPNEPARRRSMLEDERMSSDSGVGNFWIFSMGSSSAATFSWWVISTTRERPSAVDLRSGEDQHRVGMRAQSGVTEITPLSRVLSFSPSTTIFDSFSTASLRYLRLTLNGNRQNQNVH